LFTRLFTSTEATYEKSNPKRRSVAVGVALGFCSASPRPNVC
jgi:hypothetical protein